MRTILAAVLVACLFVPGALNAAAIQPAELPHDAKDTWWPYQSQLKRVSNLLENWQLDGLDRLLDSLGAAAKAERDPQLARIVHHYRGSALAQRNRVHEAESLFAQCAAAARRAGDKRSELAARAARASMMRVRGQTSQAEREYRAILHEGPAGGLRFSLMPTRSMLGYTQFELGRLEDARRTFLKMHAEAKAARSEMMLMTAEGGLARCYHGLGTLPEARDWYARTVARAKARGAVGEMPSLLLNLAFIEDSIGDPAVAEGEFDEARRLAERMGQTDQWVMACIECARRRRTEGDLAQAESLLVSGLPRARGVLNRYYLADFLLQLGQLRFAQDRGAEGERWTRASVTLLDSIDAFHQPTLLAEAVGTLKEYERAAPALAMLDSVLAAGRLDHTAGGTAMGQLHLQRGALLTQLGRPAAAIGELVPALRAESMAGEDVFAYGSIHVARAYRALGRPDSASWWAHHALDTLSAARRRTQDAATLLQADEYASWLGFELATTELGRTGRTREASERVALGELLDLGERTIADRMLSHSTAAARALTVDRVQHELMRPGEVLVQFSFGDDTTLVFALTNRDLRTWYAPSLRRLRPRLDRLERLLADPEVADESRWESAARSLGEDLFGPGATILDGAKTLLLAADRLEGRALEPLIVKGRALDDGRAVAFVPSLRALSVLRARATPARTGPLSVLGRSRDEAGRPLEGVRREARELASTYAGVRVAIDDRRAAREQLRDPIATSDVLHFATHGKFDRGRPWQSGLLVAPAGGDPWLRASAIVNARVRARLCVMTSCSSLGSAQTGGSTGGLAEAWLLSGVGTVIATRWDVSDAAATEFSLRFYDRLAQGEDAATALSTARAALRADPRFHAPRYWAGFVLLGEPATRVKLTRRNGARADG